MKVLFLTYPRIGLNRGGFQIQIERTKQALCDAGVDVVLFDPWQNQLESVDVCHVFSIDASCFYHVERAAKMGIPIVISPVFNAFAEGRIQLKAKVLLSRYIPGFYSDLRRAERMLGLANRVIALNDFEKRSLIEDLNSLPELCSVVPNGINLGEFHVDATHFEARFGVRDYLLQVGSIDPNKNQLTAIEAAKALGKPLVIIGKAAPNEQDYFERCVAAAAASTIFAGYIDNSDPLLASAYAGARALVMPSFKEVMPLVLYEAAAAGCNLLVSDRVPVDDALSEIVNRFRPDRVDELIGAINTTYCSEIDRARISNIAASMPKWSDVAASLCAIYSDLAEKRCR